MGRLEPVVEAIARLQSTRRRDRGGAKWEPSSIQMTSAFYELGLVGTRQRMMRPSGRTVEAPDAGGGGGT